MTTLQTTGRIWMAKSAMSQAIHVAWGEGDGAWSSPPGVTGSEAGLIAEIGRRVASVARYVVPDEDGLLRVRDSDGVFHRYSESSVPTDSIYIKVDFDYTEATGQGVREVGVIIGTVTDPDLPAGQKYFLPADIVDPGTMIFYTQPNSPIYRFPDRRERFEYVITF